MKCKPSVRAIEKENWWKTKWERLGNNVVDEHFTATRWEIFEEGPKISNYRPSHVPRR